MEKPIAGSVILGREAEGAATLLLEGMGYVILARNFRTRRGEIDLVAQDGDTVVFIEVKARSGSSFGGAAGAVGAVKRSRVVAAARAYIQSRGLDCPMRFDVVTLEAGRWEHIRGAFLADD